MSANREFEKHRRESERQASKAEVEAMREYIRQQEEKTGRSINEWEAIRGTDATNVKTSAPTAIRETMDRMLRAERRKESRKARDPRVRRSDLYFDEHRGVRYF
jgi:hypothetical protein